MTYSSYDELLSPIFVWNAKDGVKYFNSAFSQFVSAPPRVIRSIKSLSDLFEHGSEQLIELLNESKNGPTIGHEIALTPKREDATAKHALVKAFNSEKNTVFVLQDLSVERELFSKYKRNIEELKLTHQSIVQADKLATLGEIAAGISHEINNPLTMACGYLEVLKDALNPKLSEDDKGVIETLSQSLERITEIVRNMKKFVHQQTEDERKYHDLKDVVIDSTKYVEHLLQEKGVKLNLKLGADTFLVLANRVKLEQVCVNLITNAVDALEESKTKDPQITVGLAHNSEHTHLVLNIQDNGPGIPLDKAEDIFQPFFTTKAPGKGTGLGLAVCQKIVQQHQGQITLMANRGGAHFEIQLPGVEVSSYVYNQAQLQKIGQSDNPARILVVDDEPQILNLMYRYCKESGHLFIGSATLLEARRILEHIEIDLLITDYQLKTSNAQTLVSEVKKALPDLPIVYMTSKLSEEEIEKAFQAKTIQGHIAKPFTKEQAMRVIEEIIKCPDTKSMS